MLYVVGEHFEGDPTPVYRRFRERGRLAPEGLRCVDSWVTADLQRCCQVMECDDARLCCSDWMAQWKGLVDFQMRPGRRLRRGRLRRWRR